MHYFTHSPTYSVQDYIPVSTSPHLCNHPIIPTLLLIDIGTMYSKLVGYCVHVLAVIVHIIWGPK